MGRRGPRVSRAILLPGAGPNRGRSASADDTAGWFCGPSAGAGGTAGRFCRHSDNEKRCGIKTTSLRQVCGKFLQIIWKNSRISPCTRGDLQIDLQNYPACGVGCETCSQIHTARTVPPAGPLPWALVIEGSFGAQPKDSPHMMSQIQHDATQKGTSHTAASERHAYPYTSVQALARAASPARRCKHFAFGRKVADRSC